MIMCRRQATHCTSQTLYGRAPCITSTPNAAHLAYASQHITHIIALHRNRRMRLPPCTNARAAGRFTFGFGAVAVAVVVVVVDIVAPRDRVATVIPRVTASARSFAYGTHTHTHTSANTGKYQSKWSATRIEHFSIVCCLALGGQ